MNKTATVTGRRLSPTEWAVAASIIGMCSYSRARSFPVGDYLDAGVKAVPWCSPSSQPSVLGPLAPALLESVVLHPEWLAEWENRVDAPKGCP